MASEVGRICNWLRPIDIIQLAVVNVEFSIIDFEILVSTWASHYNSVLVVRVER